MLAYCRQVFEFLTGGSLTLGFRAKLIMLRDFPSGSQGKRLILLIAYAATSIFYISLILHLPVSIYSQWIFDDAMFWTNAYSILTTGWLGEFDQLTLAKGPGFPFFLVLNALSGLPVTLTLSALFLFVAYLLSAGLVRLGVGQYWAFFIFLGTVLLPSNMPVRIIRDNFYGTLTLATVVCLVWLLIGFNSKKKAAVAILLSGIVFALFFLTREEVIWIAPAFMVFFSLLLLTPSGRSLLKARARSLLATAIVSSSLISAVAVTNFIHYGAFQTNDFTQGSFQGALDSLQGIKVKTKINYVPVPSEARDIAYSVSPAFKELQPYFEGPGKSWQKFGCELYVDTCGDFAGGWFMWAFRDGAAVNGHFSSAAVANDYFGRIKQDISNACASGKIECENRPLPFVQSADVSQIPSVLARSIEVTMSLLSVDSTSQVAASNGSPIQLRLVSAFLGNPNFAPIETGEQIVLSGWYAGEDWISYNCNGSPDWTELDRLPSDDISKYFNDPALNNSRFELQVGRESNCLLLDHSTINGQAEISPIKIDELVDISPIRKSINGKEINFDSVRVLDPGENFKMALGIKSNLQKIYSSLLPIATIFGLTSFLILVFLRIFRPRKTSFEPNALLIPVVSVAWILFFTRIVLLTFIDSTSFPAITNEYLSPALSVLFLASSASVLCLAMETRARFFLPRGTKFR